MLIFCIDVTLFCLDQETLEGLKPEKINAGAGRTGRVRRDAGYGIREQSLLEQILDSFGSVT